MTYQEIEVDREEIGDNIVCRVLVDETPSSPREWSNLTTIRGWHRRYNIGDGPNIDTTAFDSWDDMIATLIHEEGPLVLMAPLYWYEHSGATCSMGAPITHPSRTHGKCPVCGHYGTDCTGTGKIDAADLAAFRSACLDDAGWDSGVAGIVYVTAKSQADIGVSDDDLADVARQEVDTYAAYVQGNVYGYVVELLSTCDHGDTHADVLDSCWGYVGESDYAMQEARSHVGWSVVQVMRSALSGAAPWSTS